MAGKLLTYTALASLSLGTSAMYFVTRDEWNAVAPRGDWSAISDPLGVKVHYLGPEFEGREHSECDDYMLSIQEMHMADEEQNWMDIAYNLAVCQHGYVYDGRGAGHKSGANGDEILNAKHYAVLAFLGKEGITDPSNSMIIGIQDAIAYLRLAGAGDEILGHKDGYGATECPGEALYALVNDGTLDPGTLWEGGEHKVKQGETLDDLQKQYNVPKRYIIDANNLEKPYKLTTNMTLEIPPRGVPLGESGGGGSDFVPFPGSDFFKDEPNDPIIEAMGKRLVEVGCDEYTDGPSAQWSDEDQAAYQCWQEQQGYTGSDADGWPGETTWDALEVPKA